MRRTEQSFTRSFYSNGSSSFMALPKNNVVDCQLVSRKLMKRLEEETKQLKSQLKAYTTKKKSCCARAKENDKDIDDDFIKVLMSLQQLLSELVGQKEEAQDDG